MNDEMRQPAITMQKKQRPTVLVMRAIMTQPLSDDSKFLYS